MDLNEIMSFDHVIAVHKDGSVTDANGIYAPEVYVETDDEGQILADHERDLVSNIRATGWDVLTGYTGQWSYSGPLMHSSESIRGGLADDILSNPGTYVAVTVETLDDSEDAAGWAVLFREDCPA